MKIIITGASGLLGRAIKKNFEENSSWSVVGLGFSRLQNGIRKCDLRDEEEVKNLIHEVKPDVVIHAAAERRPDVVSNNEVESNRLNITATEYLAKHVDGINGFMLYISTDYVFDGRNPPYKTTDDTNPLNKYGEAKLLGEKATLSNCKNSGVLRVPILYGDVEYIEESAVTTLLKPLLDVSKKTTVSNYEKRFPTLTSDIAVVCRQIIEYREKNENFNGIWHWRGCDKLTKFAMIQCISRVFDLPMEHISADNEPTKGAPRPFDCEFDCSLLENIGVSQRTSFEVGIKLCLAPFMVKK